MNNSVLPMVSSASPERGWNFYGFGLFRFFFLLLLFKMSVYTVNFIPLNDIGPWYKVHGWIVSLIKSVYVCTESSPSLNSNSFKSFLFYEFFFPTKTSSYTISRPKQQKQVWMTRNKNIAIDPSEQSQCPKALRAFTARAPWLNTSSPGAGKHKLLVLMDF